MQVLQTMQHPAKSWSRFRITTQSLSKRLGKKIIFGSYLVQTVLKEKRYLIDSKVEIKNEPISLPAVFSLYLPVLYNSKVRVIFPLYFQ